MKARMRSADKEWEELESLVRQHRMLGENDAAVRQRLGNEIAIGLMEIYSGRDEADALGMFYLADMGNYDPAKGTFRSFVTSRLKLRKKDMQHEDAGDHRVTVVESGERKQKWVSSISLDTTVDEENRETIGAQIVDRNAISGQGFLEAEENEVALISLMLMLPQKLNERAGNPNRINYFRMFFTDDSVEKIHTAGGRLYYAHERDLFRAMALPFLDFFMDERCRSVSSLLKSDLKAYGQMVPGRPMEPPRRPPYKEGHLPNDIYMQHLNSQTNFQINTPSTISNQWNAYAKFLKDNGL